MGHSFQICMVITATLTMDIQQKSKAIRSNVKIYSIVTVIINSSVQHNYYNYEQLIPKCNLLPMIKFMFMLILFFLITYLIISLTFVHLPELKIILLIFLFD